MSSFRFPVYQIDFTAVTAGKRVAATKRRIRWRFGFPNLAALEEGRNGTDCRGEEHEIVIVWSITSGKRQILMDGKEIHYSATRTGIIDHSWSSKGNHVLKVVCHAAPPMSANPGFRQYDLFIDGQSFFNMPKVYELGVKASGERMPGRNDYAEYSAPPAYSSPRAALKAPTTRSEEDADLQRAIDASLAESRQHLSRRGIENSAPNQEVDLFDAGAGLPVSSPPPTQPGPSDQSVMSYMSAPTQSTYPPAAQAQSFASPPPQQAYPGAPPPPQPYPGAPPQPYGAPLAQNFPALPSSQPPAYGAPPAQPHYGGAEGSLLPPTAAAPAPYSSGLGDFAPTMHGAGDPFAPKPPTHSDIASQILKGYSSPAPPAPVDPQQMAAPEVPEQAPSLSMNGLAITSGKEEENLSELEKAMRKLVNVDHIDEPAEEQLKLTMKQKEDEEAKNQKHRSKPLPPAAKNRVGSGATLKQISEVKPHVSSPKEGIMNAPPQPWHPEAAAAGMLVVHASNQNGGGPPPLAPRGVGVVHGQGYGYGQQYPQQPTYQYHR